jgi:hypothetical protein
MSEGHREHPTLIGPPHTKDHHHHPHSGRPDVSHLSRGGQISCSGSHQTT